MLSILVCDIRLLVEVNQQTLHLRQMGHSSGGGAAEFVCGQPVRSLVMVLPVSALPPAPPPVLWCLACRVSRLGTGGHLSDSHPQPLHWGIGVPTGGTDHREQASPPAMLWSLGKCPAAQGLRAEQALPPACSLASRHMDLNSPHPDHLADGCWCLLMSVHHWR